MAPKKPTPFEQPPRADSSSDEEEEEEVSNDEAEEDASDESDEEEDTPKPEKGVETPKPESSSEDDGSDSGSDDDAPLVVTKSPVAKSLDLSVKPAVAKPAAEVKLAPFKVKQPAPAPAPAPASASAVTVAVLGKKRSGESKTGAKDSKKSKKVADVEDRRVVVDEEVKKVGEDSKKQLFQRLFSEEDEIEVLKGMLEYYAKKGIDPLEDLNAFHEYVKKSIHVDVTSAQLSDKIRRLRKKYEKNASKSKEGVDRTFGKPHEQLSYDLSKKIWGSENGRAAVSASGGFELKVNGKGKRTPKPNMTPDQKEKHASSLQIPKVVKNEEGRVRQDSLSSFCFAELAKSKDAAALGLSENFFKKGLDLLGDEVKAEMEEKWKGLLTAELELYYKRLELTREQVKLVMDAHNK